VVEGLGRGYSRLVAGGQSGGDGCIYIFTGHYPPPENANSVRIYYFTGELRKRGHRVVVVNLFPRAGGGGSRAGFFGEEVLDFEGYGRGVGGRLKRYSSIALELLRIGGPVAASLSRILETCRPRLVVSSIPPLDAALVGYRVAESYAAPFVLDVRDIVDHRIAGRLPPIASNALLEVLRKLYRSSDLVIATTEAQKAYLERAMGLGAVEVVHNGADVDLYRRFSASIGVPGRERKGYAEVVFLGDLSWRYHMVDIAILSIYVANKILGEGRVRLKIIGEGPLREPLQRLAERVGLRGAVDFKGYLDRETLIRELLYSDIAITGRPIPGDLWSITSMRSTIYEYIAAGLPILAFGPSPSYIESFILSESVGLYVASNSPAAIGSTLASMAESIGSFDRHRIMGVASKYDRKALARKFADLVEGLL